MEWTRGCTIGQGSSATVSAATLRSSGDILAVKSADLSKSETLQREQQILSTLTSPYIVSYRGFDVTSENGNLLYNLFMDFSPEGTLSDVIRRQGGQLPEELIVHYTRHILFGLEYLHARGLTHCDIKGRNILIAGAAAKIADFGSARWDGEEAEAEGMRGTPPYMAPEVARGEDQRSAADVWALGCTVIEMATGKSPWTGGGDAVQMLYRVGFSGESPGIPPSLSVKGTDFLTKCLVREAEERWTAAQLLNHPFLTTTEIQDYSKLSNNSSPTSILDRRFWSETEQESPAGRTESSSSSDTAVSRMGRLWCPAAAAEWWWDDDQKWVTVRENVGAEDLDTLLMDAADRSSVGGSVEGGVGGQKWDWLGGDIISGDVGQILCLRPNKSLYLET